MPQEVRQWNFLTHHILFAKLTQNINMNENGNSYVWQKIGRQIDIWEEGGKIKLFFTFVDVSKCYVYMVHLMTLNYNSQCAHRFGDCTI